MSRSLPSLVAAAALITCLPFVEGLHAEERPRSPYMDHATEAPGNEMLDDYFRAETARVAAATLSNINTLADWEACREDYHRQFREMLGLEPLPERTPLQATITGRVDHEEFFVENLHFQSLPGLYVTGNLYVPKHLDGPAPTILYVCGHARVKIDGVSYGNKTHYQHHGAWFARHGYVCLVIDTLQLGEIEGHHHGTHNLGMWFWVCRGYCPAGVEAWNCVRALDYLETRPEVDKTKFGVTGRSGGGAYSWWIAALDDRIQCAVPVAGMVDLESHVVQGCVEGHCDCMFMINTYRWDYAQVAALIAPRPLLLTNTDKDRIFPLEGVLAVHRDVRRIYDLYDAGNNFALQISEGPHQDIPELQVAAFRWMNLHLKGEDPPIEDAAVSMFEPSQLKVFAEIPKDERNTTIFESFVPAAPAWSPPADAEQWAAQRDTWYEALRTQVFRGWPNEMPPPEPTVLPTNPRDGVLLRYIAFDSQEALPQMLVVVQAEDLKEPEGIRLEVLAQREWEIVESRLRATFGTEAARGDAGAPYDLSRFRDSKQVHVFMTPRGCGPMHWDTDPKEANQIRRRFLLLGQTEDGMRVWDIRRAIQTLRVLEGWQAAPLDLVGRGESCGWVVYASLFEPDLASLRLVGPTSSSHREGPIFLNVLKYLDLPQALAMAAERTPTTLVQLKPNPVWNYATETASALGWPDDQLTIELVDAVDEP